MAKDRKTIEGKYSELIKSHKQRDKPSKTERDAEYYYKESKDHLDYLHHHLGEAKTREEQDDYLQDISSVYGELKTREADYYKQQADRQKSTHKSFQSSMFTATRRGSMHEQINVQRHATSFGDAYQMAYGVSGVGVLEGQVLKERDLVERKRAALQEATAGLQPGDSTKKIERYARNLDISVASLGKKEAALDVQRREGIDTRGVLAQTQEVAERARGRISQEQIRADIKSGAVTGSDIEARLAKSSQALIEAQEAFAKALKTGEGNIAELGEAAVRAAGDTQELEAQHQELKSQGLSGFGGSKLGRGLATAAKVAQVGGDVVSAGASMYSQWAIGRDMDTSNLRGRLMGVANQRFDDARAASQGDMASLMRLGRYAESAHFGTTISGKAEGAAVAGAVGSGLSTVGSATTGGLAGGVAGGPWGALAGFLSGAASGTAQTSGQIAKIQSGAVGAEAFLDAEGTKRQELTAMDYQTAAVKQVAMDHTRNSWRAAAGAGSSMGGILKTTRDSGFLADMALTHGLNLDQVNNLTQAGVGALGKQFRTGDMGAAGTAYRSGILSSPEQYMQLRGEISQTGGGKGDLEKILKAAVASGMDSSKNVMEMVRSMGDLSAASSVGGYSTFGGTSTRVMATIGALKEAGVAENMRTGAAANIVSRQDDIARNRGNTVADFMMSYDMIGRGFKPGTLAGEATATMTASEAQELMSILEGSGSEKEKNTQIGKRGFKGLIGKTAEETRNNIRGQARSSLKKSIIAEAPNWSFGGKTAEEGKFLLDTVLKDFDGQDISEEDYNKADSIFAEAQRVSGKPVTSLKAWTAAGGLKNPKLGQIPDSSGKTGKTADVSVGADAAAAYGQLTMYNKGLEAVNGNLGEIVTSMAKAAQTLDPEMFKPLRDSSKNLDASVSNLVIAVNALNLKIQGDDTGSKKELGKIKKQPDESLGRK